MGNKQSPRVRNTIFLPQKTSGTSLSLTVPSLCTSPSFHLSAKKSTSGTSSEAFNWSQMQALYLEEEFLTVDHLTFPILKAAGAAFEALKRQMAEICWELRIGTMKVPEEIQARFGANPGLNVDPSTFSDKSGTNPVLMKLIVHFVRMLYVHDIILKYFRLKQGDFALDLIKQIAVRHALMGIPAAEFRMMNWFQIHYLIKNKLISDENISGITTYLNTFSNYIERFYDSQSVRYAMLDELTHEKRDDRNNKARENYRLMKKWKRFMETFTGQENIVEMLLEEQERLHQTEEDVESIDTVTLKRDDFIMKHFTKREETIPEKPSVTTEEKTASKTKTVNLPAAVFF